MQTQTITSTLVTNYGYDIANRLTSVNGQPYTWDDNGNLLNDGAQTFGYDQANRLKQVVQGAITTTFAYNGVGDRLSQTVGITTTHYVLDPGAGLTQVLADGTNTYLYGNDRLAQYQAAMQYFGADGLASVRQLYDASGMVIGSTRYDPYGSVMSQGGTATSVFAFAGEQHDAATGLEYLRARYYSAAQGRFVTRDVWEGDYQRPLSLNAWNYTNANPVNYSDPSGHCILGVDCLIIGGVVVVLGIVAVSTIGCTAATPPAAPGPTTTPGTEFAGYVLLLVCGRGTDCANGAYDHALYPELPLQPLQKAFRDQGGVANYVPGDFRVSDAQTKGLISQVGSTIQGMVKQEESKDTKGVFVVGHSLGGNMVVDGVVKYKASAQNPAFVRGVVLIEPDLVDLSKPDYNSRLDTQGQATELSNDGMLIVGTGGWFTGAGPSSMPTPGSKQLELFTTKAETHYRAATAPDMVSAVMSFFLRRK